MPWESPPLVKTAIPLPLWEPRSMKRWCVGSDILPLCSCSCCRLVSTCPILFVGRRSTHALLQWNTLGTTEYWPCPAHSGNNYSALGESNGISLLFWLTGQDYSLFVWSCHLSNTHGLLTGNCLLRVLFAAIAKKLWPKNERCVADSSRWPYRW